MPGLNEESPHSEVGTQRRFLTPNQWFTIGLTVLTAILTVVVHVGLQEWYQPDVRYEEGTWYRDGTTAIISLRIKNYGADDAENVRLTAIFDHALRNVSLDDPAIRLSDDPNRSNDPKVYTGEIDRLVPKQTTLLYFSLSVPSTAVPLGGTFVKSITYKGGQGRTGEPVLPMIASYLRSGITWTAFYILVFQVYFLFRKRSDQAELADREMRCRWIEDRYARIRQEEESSLKDVNREMGKIRKKITLMNELVERKEKEVEDLERRKKQAEGA